MQTLNLAARFLLELCALAAVGYWGFRTGDSTSGRLLLAVGAPLLLATAWGLLASPAARWPLPRLLRLLFEAAVMVLAALALAAAGATGLAGAFLAAWIVNAALLEVLGQR